MFRQNEISNPCEKCCMHNVRLARFIFKQTEVCKSIRVIKNKTNVLLDLNVNDRAVFCFSCRCARGKCASARPCSSAECKYTRLLR